MQPRALSKGDFLRHFSVRMSYAVVCASVVVIAGCPSLASTIQTGCTKSTTYSIGDTVRTALGPNSCVEMDGTYEDFYNVTTTAQTGLRISVSSPGMTTYLRVLDAYRTQVVNSAVQQTPDTAVTVRTLMTAGSYQIAVRATVPGTTGAYRLVAVPDSSPIVGCSTVIWVTTGIQTTQNLTNADCTQGSAGSTRYYHVYTIVLVFPQSVTFTETSTAFPPSMILYSPLAGSQTSTVDSTGSVATLPGFATQTDVYQLQVSSSAALKTGAYTLNIK